MRRRKREFRAQIWVMTSVEPAPTSKSFISFHLRRNQSGAICSKAEFINAQSLDAKLERRRRKPQRFRRSVRPRNAATRSSQGRLDGLALLCLKPFVHASHKGSARQYVRLHAQRARSEERRVGKECSCRSPQLQ